MKVQTALPWNVTDTKNNISGTGELEDRWDLVGGAAAFNDLKTVPGVTGAPGTPFVSSASAAGTQAAANYQLCVTEAASLDSSYTPSMPGWTTATAGHSAALAKFGCFVSGSTLMLPPAFGTSGDESHNQFRGEPFHEWDLSVSKEVRFTERLRGQFRFEAFNVLNQTDYFTNSDVASTASSFGSSRQTPDVGIANATVGSGGPRSLQIGIRLQF